MNKLMVSVMIIVLAFAVRTQATTVFGVTNTEALVQFEAETPGTASTISITGLQAGETILGIDFRPADDQLYALTSGERIYTINTATGAATLKSTLSADPVDSTNPFVGLSGISFGVDFNPVADRLRVVSDAGQNLRVNVDTGRVLTDAALNPGTPSVVGSAYTNSFPGAAITALFGIDSVSNMLVIQNPPNNGTLSDVGPLGVDISTLCGFDIRNGIGYGSFRIGIGNSQLYTVDLANGPATLVGQIGSGLILRGLAIGQPGVLRFSQKSFSAGEETGNAAVTVERAGGSEGDVSIEVTTTAGSAINPQDFIPSATVVLNFADGDSTPQTVNELLIDDNLPETPETVNLSLANPSGGAVAGGPAVLIIADDEVPATTAFVTNGVRRMLRFNTAAPGTILATVDITGSFDPTEQIIGIESRPSNGMLYAITQDSLNAGRIYTIDTNSGAATLVATLSAALNGSFFGMDFDPTIDSIRVISDTGSDIQVDPDNGNVTANSAPAYASGDVNFPTPPTMTAIGYSDNYPGSTNTTLYGIDTNLSSLAVESASTSGELNTIGALGEPVIEQAGFDIRTVGSQTNPMDMGFLMSQSSGELFVVNLETGATTSLGEVSANTFLVTGFTLARPSLTLSIDDGTTSATAGQTLAYTLNFANSSSFPLSDLVLTENLPPGATFNAAASSAGWTETAPGSGVFTSSQGTLDAGAGGNKLFAVTVPFPSGPANVVNTATISSMGSDGVVRSTSTDSDALSCLFCDDFEDGTISAAWTYVKLDWIESAGALQGTPAGKKAIAIATPAFSGCSVCTLETSMRSSGGALNKIWFDGWYLDKKNTIQLLMKEENDRWVLKEKSGGTTVAKGKGIKTIDPGVSFIVRMTFDGTTIQVFVDDMTTPLISMAAAAAVPAGTIGYEVKGTTGFFDYILVF